MLRTSAVLVLALALSVPSAFAFRPTRPGEGGGSGANFRMPIPEREVRDAATVLHLCSEAKVLKAMNSALSRSHMKVERITTWSAGGGRTGYKFVLVPLNPPPPGIHAGGYFTATTNRTGAIVEVTAPVLQK